MDFFVYFFHGNKKSSLIAHIKYHSEHQKHYYATNLKENIGWPFSLHTSMKLFFSLKLKNYESFPAFHLHTKHHKILEQEHWHIHNTQDHICAWYFVVNFIEWIKVLLKKKKKNRTLQLVNSRDARQASQKS
jgi:hypothetical protein